MHQKELFRLETPYRETLAIKGTEFGSADAPESLAVVGALRGNEIQQAYICARLVQRLQQLEEEGRITGRVKMLVIPVVNSFSMNIAHRFWPMDSTDINRMFPGYDQGETTQRIAAGLFEHIQHATYGIQLASYYLPGHFEPHVRVTNAKALDPARLRDLARMFGFRYALVKEPSPFDTTTLNYNWQVWNTYACSVYSSVTSSINERAAQFVLARILQFMEGIGAITLAEGELLAPAAETQWAREEDLVNVRTQRAGFFRPVVAVTQTVQQGDVLAEILDTDNCAVREVLVSPVSGTVFFIHESELINGETIAFKVLHASEVL
ncbi:M14 family metallopeptidase [Parvibacter caecicola]|uniref:Succinylglutamate desuccinylase/Aspartoacylase catalytic domain-containing protein n=1 Tax=Parvibacter caecicola TaxID=747645 RepID=A0A7W5GQL0_9ACTN|nr:M14 family metallopeptidase [Parvibacter caecicola]MBB3171569.1 hypothetical protein [Parvibacter caecicola]MCR2040828.1 M14 family metallopeptidase [Parvibacter caecicola]RNL11046.1 succinylglutamate desuccinylase [Parvibacter caecicola]